MAHVVSRKLLAFLAANLVLVGTAMVAYTAPALSFYRGLLERGRILPAH